MSTQPRPWTKFYAPDVAADIELPQESITDSFQRSVTDGGATDATVFFNRARSWREIGDQVDRTARALHELGVGKGDLVAIVLPNCPQHIVALHAVWRLGAVVVEHNPLYTKQELETIFADHRAKVVISWDKTVERLQSFDDDVRPDHIVAVNMMDELPAAKRWALRLPLPKTRQLRERLSQPTPGALRWQKFIDVAPIDATVPTPSVDDLAAIQYTSGTTGAPKGAILTHSNIASNVAQARAWFPYVAPGQETMFGVLPIFHSFGMLIAVFGTVMRSTMVLIPTPDVDLILDAWKKRASTVLSGVPPLFERLALKAKESGQDITSNRYCVSGAMTLPHRITELWESIAKTTLIEGYGMTECSPIITGNPVHHSRRPGTLGLPFPATDVRIVDPDNPLEVVPQGQPGELLARGPQVFQGYWNNEEATARAFVDRGWVRTGDIVTADEDGFLTMVDRLKDIIITGGFNVSPTEVENALREHDSIEDIGVIGVKRPDGSEMVVAAVILKEGTALDEEDIRAFGKKTLAAYKVPRRFFTVTDLPKNAMGKLLRKQVRDHAPGGLAA